MEEKNVNKEGSKICKVLRQIESVIRNLRKEILPELKEKLDPILYISPENCQDMSESPVMEGSGLFMILEDFRRDLEGIVDMLSYDIVRRIEL